LLPADCAAAAPTSDSASALTRRSRIRTDERSRIRTDERSEYPHRQGEAASAPKMVVIYATVYAPQMPDASPRKPAGLSFFFPAYNDAGTIASLVIRVVQAAGRLTPDFEVIVVNDGSTDATAEIANELARKYPQVRVIHHERNRGYGGALRTGFASATKELIAYTDGDAQYDPAEIEALWTGLTPDADMVTGYKIRRADPRHRIIIGRLYHYAVKLLFRLRVRDVDCDFRLMRREIFERVRLERNTGVICLEMMRKIQDAGFHVLEVPVHHYHRSHGRSQFFNVRRVFWTAVDVVKLWVQLVVLGRQSSAVLFRDPTIAPAAPPETR
jgi:glycosyltransferase involved in cell wall biosynthesis